MTDTADSPKPNDDNLWDRIGGQDRVDALLEAFYVRVLDDPELAPFFKDTPMDRLRRMQREFFSTALGGPLTYSGRPLAHVHHGLGIKPVHVQLFVEHLLATLKDTDLGEDDVQRIYDRIHIQADELIGRAGGLGG